MKININLDLYIFFYFRKMSALAGKPRNLSMKCPFLSSHETQTTGTILILSNNVLRKQNCLSETKASSSIDQVCNYILQNYCLLISGQILLSFAYLKTHTTNAFLSIMLFYLCSITEIMYNTQKLLFAK